MRGTCQEKMMLCLDILEDACPGEGRRPDGEQCSQGKKDLSGHRPFRSPDFVRGTVLIAVEETHVEQSAEHQTETEEERLDDDPVGLDAPEGEEPPPGSADGPVSPGVVITDHGQPVDDHYFCHIEGDAQQKELQQAQCKRASVADPVGSPHEA